MSPPAMLGYGVALLSCLLVALLSALFRPLLVYSPSALFFASVAISARFFGRGPGLLATLLSALVFDYISLEPPFAFNFTFPMPLVSLIEFVLVALLITYLSDSLRVALRHAQTNLTLLDTLLASAPVGMGFLDRQLRVVRINDELARQDGTTGSNAQGRPTRELVPDLWPKIEPLLARVLSTGEPVINQEVTGEVPSRPGESRSFLVSYYPVRGERSEIEGVGSVVVDITERKRLEDERARLFDRARTAEARYRALFENLADPIFVVGPDSRHLDVNRAASDLLGYSREELLSRSLSDVVAIKPDWTEREFAHLVSTGSWKGELELRRRDGSSVPVEAQSIAVALPTETVYVTVVRDLIERRQAVADRVRLAREEAERSAVERERSRLRAILDQAPAGISYVDAATRRVLMNARAREILGLSSASDYPLEQLIRQVREPDGRRPNQAELPALRALRGESTLDRELAIVRSDGQQVPILLNAAPIYRGPDQIDGVVVAFQDIASLKDLDRMREEFMSAIAHELRSPIAVIRGHAQLAILHGALADRARDAFAAIIPQTDRIAHTIDDLLLVLRLRPGPRALTVEHLDLTEVVRVVVARTAQDRPSYTLHYRDDGPVDLDADPSLLDLLVTRLIDNAIRYSPRESSIDVSIQQMGDEAVVSIADHGVGIPPERQAHVFTPFYEPVPSGAPGYVGVISLDLYLSKQIVEAFQGRIWFTSTPGQGSTFYFALPLTGARSKAAGPSTARGWQEPSR